MRTVEFGTRAPSSRESNGGAGPRPGGFFFSALGWSIRLKRMQQRAGRRFDLVDGTLKRRLVGLGRMGEAAELSYELQRRGANLLVGYRRFEIEQGFYTSAHMSHPLSRARLIGMSSPRAPDQGLNCNWWIRRMLANACSVAEVRADSTLNLRKCIRCVTQAVVCIVGWSTNGAPSRTIGARRQQ